MMIMPKMMMLMIKMIMIIVTMALTSVNYKPLLLGAIVLIGMKYEL